MGEGPKRLEIRRNEQDAMRLRLAFLIGCLGWPLAGCGDDPPAAPPPTDAVVQPGGDVSDITAYLEEKFRMPAPPAPETPPGSNDVVATAGRIFRNVQPWKVEPDGVTFRHDEGLTKLEFPLLPEEWQKKYAYDPAEAAAYQRVMADAMQEAERTQQKLRQQMQSELDAQKSE